MASFSAVHPSTSHPSFPPPSAPTFPSSSLSSLWCPSSDMEWNQGSDCGGIQYLSQLQPRTSSTHPAIITPVFILLDFFILLCAHSGSLFLFSVFCYSSLLLAFPRRVESHSVWCLAGLLSLCTTSLHHVNLWLALHRGLLTTHACLHATPLWIEEITLTLTLRAKTLAGWLSALSQHSQLLSHSHNIEKCFVPKSAYRRWEKWQVLNMLNIALLALMCE